MEHIDVLHICLNLLSTFESDAIPFVTNTFM